MSPLQVQPWRQHTVCPSPGTWLGRPRDSWAWTGSDTDLDSCADTLLATTTDPGTRAMIRVSWKALRDSGYRHLALRAQDWVRLEDAGLFDDGLSPLQWQQLQLRDHDSITPMPGRRTLGDTPVVLVLPGALAPCHEGHVQAVLRAEAAARAQGWDVVASYLSPSHDAYVATKAPGSPELPGTEVWPAWRRVAAARQQTLATGCLVDAWEACSAPGALNFTDVMDRLARVASRAMGQAVDAVLVAGSDNAGFAGAMGPGRRCIVVARDTTTEDKMTQVAGQLDAEEQERVVFLHGEHCVQASRMIRQQPMRAVSRLPDGCHGWLLRDDGTWALSAWDLGEVGATAWQHFVEGLACVLRAHSPMPSWPLVRMRVEDQELRVKAWQATLPADHRLGVLDACMGGLPGALTLRGSRVFTMAGDQTHALRHLWHDLPTLDGHPGVTHLLDDDSVTGGTFRAARQLPGVSDDASMMTTRELMGTPLSLDPLDARDFLLGSRDGGLVVEARAGQGVWRVPYWAPYVDLARRACVRDDLVVSFSNAVLALNRAFFRACPVRVAQADPLAQAFLFAAGATASDDLHDICQRLHEPHTWNAITAREASPRRAACDAPLAAGRRDTPWRLG